MAQRPIFSKADIASAVATVAGNALTAELCTQAFPESQQKRKFFDLFTVGKAATAGAAATELFIDGVQNFRFRVAQNSTVTVKAIASYNASPATSNTGFDITFTAQNNGGIVTILANSVITKFPNASTAAFALGVDAPNQAVTFTGTGIAGDTNGRWVLGIYAISEVTDIG